ncbi:hypothetical protein AB0H69_24710 [Streptomyces phaeochromogenes]|uniref:hypothetical protein n=1 Tax=Streptomyces phaeochromogenes TaxID=1923 RepID=UPI0033C790DB
MSSDTQFTADGPTIVGFQTGGANIQRGVDAAGTEVGVVGRSGKLGVRAEGGPVGIHALSDERAAVFESKQPRVPQVRLVPHHMQLAREKFPVVAGEYPIMGDLPTIGALGDIHCAADFGNENAVLWLCVAASEEGRKPAQWAQLLVGKPTSGKAW